VGRLEIDIVFFRSLGMGGLKIVWVNTRISERLNKLVAMDVLWEDNLHGTWECEAITIWEIKLDDHNQTESWFIAISTKLWY